MREITADKIRKAYKCSPMCDGFDEMADIIALLDEEIVGLEMLYKQACDAAGAQEQRARDAEKECRMMLNDMER